MSARESTDDKFHVIEGSGNNNNAGNKVSVDVAT
jgi:hypothetical protein